MTRPKGTVTLCLQIFVNAETRAVQFPERHQPRWAKTAVITFSCIMLSLSLDLSKKSRSHSAKGILSNFQLSDKELSYAVN
jgi:hypothetical protein